MKHVSINTRILLPLLAALTLLTLLSGCGKEEPSVTESQLEAGAAYLQSLDAVSLDRVDTILRTQRQARIAEERNQRLSELENGTVSVWSLFEDYAILGDSRTTGFFVYSFLPEDHVFAEAGNTILNIEEHFDELKALNPASVFICYGLNDMGRWETAADYTKSFSEIVGELQKLLPNADIYISSILPVEEFAYAEFAGWEDIPEWNEALQQMCSRLDHCWYIDNSNLVETYSDLWEPDGKHLQGTFYQHWAANMILATYDVQSGIMDSSTDTEAEAAADDAA